MPPLDAEPSAPRHRVFRLGQIELNEGTRELRVGGQPRPIESKPFALLKLLLERAPNVVTKDEVMAAIWPGVFVEESSITTAVHGLRNALGPELNDVVKTVPRVGYRIAQVPQIGWVETAVAPPAALRAADPVPGRPQWRLEKPLGVQGAPYVWLARHDKTAEQRVFKFAFTAEQLDALKREAALCRILRDRLGNRDDLVPVREWNFDEPPYFIESPYAGDDLAAWAAAQGGLAAVPLQTRLNLVAQAARTLADAHGAGVLHGDIKPANMLLPAADPPCIRLVDFGAGGLTEAARREALSRTLQDATTPEDSARAGTLLYVAPEILHGGPPTIKADIYALGILLYQMVLGDLDKPLAAGWEADIADEILRACIADAAAGDPARRLESAATLAERLAGLETTRARVARERADEAAAASLAEQIRRARQRRPWLILAAVSLLVGTLASGAAALRATRARNEAQRQAHLAEAVNLFLTKDLLGRGMSVNTTKKDETVMQAATRAESLIAERFKNDPLIAGSIYYALALFYEDHSAIPETRRAYENAVISYERAEGPYSASAAIARLRHALTEAIAQTGPSIAAAKNLVAQVQAVLPKLGARRDEVQVWLLNAQGSVDEADGRANAAAPAFHEAARLATTMPTIFEADTRLGMRFREGQVLTAAGKFDAADAVLAAVARDTAALHGPRSINALTATAAYAQALDLGGKPEQCVQIIDAMYTDLVTALGTHHQTFGAIIGIRADALNFLGRYPEAERDEKLAYDTAMANNGARSFAAVNAQQGLGSAQCRAGDLQAGLQSSKDAFDNALKSFGPKHPLPQAIGLTYVECLVVAKQYPAAQAMLRSLDRDQGAKALGDFYPGETYDVLDAMIADHLGDTQHTRDLLMPLRRAYAKPGGDQFFRTWIEDLASATAKK